MPGATHLLPLQGSSESYRAPRLSVLVDLHSRPMGKAWWASGVVIPKPPEKLHRFGDRSEGVVRGSPKSMRNGSCRPKNRAAAGNTSFSGDLGRPALDAAPPLNAFPSWALDRERADPAQSHPPPLRLTALGTDGANPIPIAPLMTVSEAAAVLRVSTKTIRRLIAKGDLQVVRVGRSVRLRQEEINGYLKAVKHYQVLEGPQYR